MRRSRKLVLTGVVVVAALGLLIEACRTPTQVTVEIRTHGFRCDEIRRLTIAVAATPEKAEQRMFDGYVAAETIRDDSAPSKNCLSRDRIGTLVVTPESGTGAIVVAASYDIGERCIPPEYKGCIVARRAFSFIDRSSLVLPMTLELVCKNVPCGVFTSCRAGECTSSKAICDEDKSTCESEAEPVIASDGGSIPPETSTLPDGAPLPPDDGGSTSEAGADATTDASTDAPADGPPHGTNYGNNCPVFQQPTDCKTTAPGNICCYFTAFMCTASGGCNGVSLPCLGREGCKGQPGPLGYCCGNASPNAGAPSTTVCPAGATPCSTLSYVTICTNDDDCPDGQWCTGTWWAPMAPQNGGPIKKCTTTAPPGQD